MNAGKQFEKDFHESAEKVMATIRLKDPAASFGANEGLRFSPRNMCDFICYRKPDMFLFELKSFAGTSIPFKSMVSGKTDRRIQQMADMAHRWPGMRACVIFNCRQVSVTYLVAAADVINFMTTSDRRSIPMSWIETVGVKIQQEKKRVHWRYDLESFVSEFEPGKR